MGGSRDVPSRLTLQAKQGGIAINRQLANLKENGIETLKDLVHILEHSYDGIILNDWSGRVFFANERSIERLAKMSSGSIIGKTTAELIQAGLVLEETKRKITYQDERKAILITHKLKTGVEALITSIPVYDKDGKPLCYISNYREITDLNNLKKELEEMKSKTESYLSELTELRNRLLKENHVVARSMDMRNVLEKLIKISTTDVNVYLSGESGAGKGVVARLIHMMSHRKEGPFVQVNCGAIPENLLESELFGYEKGAFTGAHPQGKPGLLEMARKGTVLLDEIGDLPLELQVKLLKALQEREFFRVGGVTPVKMDCRIISATNRDLERMVKDGRFREDLFYRINVIPIHISPLRERREDILPLAYHFLHRFNKKYGRDRTISSEVCNALESYNWPGNVRELENIIERLVIMSESRQIRKENLPAYIFNSQCRPEGNATQTLKEAVHELERKLIREAVSEAGSLRKAANLLGVHHTTLVKKLKAAR